MRYTRKYIQDEIRVAQYDIGDLAYKSGVSQGYLMDILRGKDQVRDYFYGFCDGNYCDVAGLVEGGK